MEENIDDRRWRVWLVTTMAAMTIIAFGYAVVAGRHAAWIPDLYNLVYDHSRPRRGEATGLFLFSFPAALGIGTFMTAVPQATSRSSIPGWMTIRRSHVLSLVWALVFFAASIHRSLAVLAFFR